MAEIKMSYIFIEKEKHDTKTVKKLVLEIIDSISVSRDDSNIVLEENDIVQYRIIQKRNTDRCYMELISNARVNKAVSSLEKINSALFKSPFQKYYHCMKDYDGISESFCKRLFPKYAEFERKLRSLILLILTEAYGGNWRDATISDDLLNKIKGTSYGNVSLNTTLENMDLFTLESYLFDKREVDYEKILDVELSSEKLNELDKAEICKIINNMRPTSLWKRHFEKFGSEEKWKTKIQEIHNVRNKVAHHKTISENEYIDINKKINTINRELNDAINKMHEENFTETGIVDILGSFALLLGKMASGVAVTSVFEDVITSFNSKIQNIVKNIEYTYISETKAKMEELGKSLAEIQLRNISGLSSWAKHMMSVDSMPDVAEKVDTLIMANEVKAIVPIQHDEK